MFQRLLKDCTVPIGSRSQILVDPRRPLPGTVLPLRSLFWSPGKRRRWCRFCTTTHVTLGWYPASRLAHACTPPAGGECQGLEDTPRAALESTESYQTLI